MENHALEWSNRIIKSTFTINLKKLTEKILHKWTFWDKAVIVSCPTVKILFIFKQDWWYKRQLDALYRAELTEKLFYIYVTLVSKFIKILYGLKKQTWIFLVDNFWTKRKRFFIFKYWCLPVVYTWIQ